MKKCNCNDCNTVIGKNFNEILYEGVLNHISQIMNQLNGEMVVYDDDMWERTMSDFSERMKNTVISYIDSQMVAAKETRKAVL